MTKRIVLAHLNIEVEDDDKRSDSEIRELLGGIIEVGTHEDLRDMDISVQLVETVEASEEGWVNAGGKLTP